MSEKTDDWFENEDNDKMSANDEEVVVDRREFLDENGVDIFKKKSAEKTVEERIKTSRSLKIKYNKWNQVDYTEEKHDDKISIDNSFMESMMTYEDLEFEKKFHEIIRNSKYKAILLNSEFDKMVINYQIINDILLYTYARMKDEYSLTRIFVLVCEYCGTNLQTMWKRLSSYMQKKILEELCEFSSLPDIELNQNTNKLF